MVTVFAAKSPRSGGSQFKETTGVCRSEELLGEGKSRRPKLIRETFNSSGCSAYSGSVSRNDCSPSLMPSSGESGEADARVLSEGMPLG